MVVWVTKGDIQAQPEGLEFKPATCSTRHPRHRQQRLRIGAGYGQQCSRCAAGLFAALFPALQGADGNTHQRGELGLREARFFRASVRGG